MIVVHKIHIQKKNDLIRTMTDYCRPTHSTSYSTMKSVRWTETCSLISITHLNDMPKEEIREIWYNKNDYTAFRQDCQTTVKALKKVNRFSKNHQVLKKNGVCERGLEHVIYEAYHTRQQRRRQKARDYVFIEQSCQRCEGNHSAESIALLYHDISTMCEHDAHMKGLRDAKEARIYHGEVKDDVCRKDLITSEHAIVDPVKVLSGFRYSSRIGRQLLKRRRTRGSICPAA